MDNRKEHEKNGQIFTNSVDPMNRYAASYNGNLALDYDPRGNTTQFGDLDLTYDVYGKVVAIDEPAMTAVYLYDASDRRVMFQVNGYATYFVLEGIASCRRWMATQLWLPTSTSGAAPSTSW